MHADTNELACRYRGSLFLSGFSTLFQQWTGINILIFVRTHLAFHCAGAPCWLCTASPGSG